MTTVRFFLAVTLLVMPAAAVLRGHVAVVDTSSTLADHGRPELVAHLLAKVERNWLQDRLDALEGTITQESAMSSMVASCSKVADSIVQGSEGVHSHVQEYMKNVCDADDNANDQVMCQKFAESIGSFMKANKQPVNLPQFCTSFFEGAVTEGARELFKVIQEKKQQEELALQAAEQSRKAAEEQQHIEQVAAWEREQEQGSNNTQAPIVAMPETEETVLQEAEAKTKARMQGAKLPQNEADALSREFESYFAAKVRRNGTNSFPDAQENITSSFNPEDDVTYIDDGDISDVPGGHLPAPIPLGVDTVDGKVSSQVKRNSVSNEKKKQLDAEFASAETAQAGRLAHANDASWLL